MSQSIFINVPLPLVNATAGLPAKVVITNSSTTTAGATDKLTDTGGTPNFVTNVQVGDIVFPGGAASSVYSTVTAVDSDSVLSISGTGNATLEASSQAYTIFTSASAHSVTYSAHTDINVGDVVINDTTGLIGKVTQVTSSTQALTDAILFNDNSTDVVVIISQNGKGGRLVSLNNIAHMYSFPGGAGTKNYIKYKKGVGSVAQLQWNNSAAQDDYSYFLAIKKLVTEVLGSEWTNVVRDMPLVAAPSGATVPVLWASDTIIT